MKKVHFKSMVMMAVAIGLVAVSCGGRGGSSSSKNPESAFTVKSVGYSWEDNEYTRQVPKPDMSVSFTGETGLGYIVTLDKPTLAQIKAYAAKVNARGFNTVLLDMEEVEEYMYSARNAEGWQVNIIWYPLKSDILILKP